MNATVSGEPARAPWHLWVLGILSLCWNAFGAYDYVMTVSHNAGYLAHVPPAAMAIVDAFPPWAVGAWALGVWVSLIASLLLLIRSRVAATAFLVSIAGALVSYVYQATTGLAAAMGGVGYWVMPAVVFIVLVAQWYYTRRMADAGVLR
jgi:hypothetical protein